MYASVHPVMTGMAAPVSVLGREASSHAFIEFCFIVFYNSFTKTKVGFFHYFCCMKKVLFFFLTLVLLSSCATASFSRYKGVGRIKQYDIYSTQLPDSFDGFRIAFATDFHYESRFTAKRLQGMVRALQAADADVLLLGGDYRGRNGGNLTELFDALSEVKTPYGTYAVMGNHDRGEN